jgi:hypothetical protein
MALVSVPTGSHRGGGNTSWKVVRWIVGSLFACFLAWLIWWLCIVWRPRSLRRIQYRFARGDQTRIQTGDLYLTRIEVSCSLRDRALRTLTGPGWTHAGFIHRDLLTGKLYVLDFGERGVEYTLLSEKLKRYAGHIAVRRLRQPHVLSYERQVQVQAYIDDLLHGHNRTMDAHRRTAISVGSSDPSHFRTAQLNEHGVNFRRTGSGFETFCEACVTGPADLNESAICTDFVRMLLQRFGILPQERFRTCTHPSFFTSNAAVNAVYEPPELLKHFETEHDHSLDACSETGTGVEYLDLDGNRLNVDTKG